MKKQNAEKTSDVLLINPFWSRAPSLPRSLFELGSFLIREGNNPKVCDLNVILNKENSNLVGKAVEAVKSYNCMVLCFTIGVNTAPFAFELINRLKKEGSFTVIVGGLLATSNPKMIFDNCKADYVIVGEGFHALNEIIASVKKGGKKIYDSRIIERGSQSLEFENTTPTITEFDSGLFEKVSGLEPYTKKGWWGTYVSKGCNNTCKYCSSSIMWGCSRKRKVSDILNEISYIKSRYGIRKFQFFDDCFTSEREFLICLLGEIKKMDIKWICNARIDSLSAELIRMMASAGCEKVYHGIESASIKVRKKIGKDINLKNEEILELLKTEKQIEIEPRCAFLCGIPGEGMNDLNETIEFIKELNSNGVSTQLNIFIPFDGVELAKGCSYKFFDKIKEFGRSDIFSPEQLKDYPELIEKYKDSNPENRICSTKINLASYKEAITRFN